MDPSAVSGDPSLEGELPDQGAPPTSPPPGSAQANAELITEDGRLLSDVQRENAFLRANIDIDSKVGKMLLQTWSGPLDTAALTAEAEELGCLRGARTEVAASPEAAERAAFAHDAEPSTTLPQKHPHDIARDVGTDILMKGGTEEDAITAGFRSLVGGALKGDRRVLVQPPPNQ
jgi:hypothetical protein